MCVCLTFIIRDNVHAHFLVKIFTLIEKYMVISYSRIEKHSEYDEIGTLNLFSIIHLLSVLSDADVHLEAKYI